MIVWFGGYLHYIVQSSAGPSMLSGSCPFVPAHAVSSRESSTDIPRLTDSE